MPTKIIKKLFGYGLKLLELLSLGFYKPQRTQCIAHNTEPLLPLRLKQLQILIMYITN